VGVVVSCALALLGGRLEAAEQGQIGVMFKVAPSFGVSSQGGSADAGFALDASYQATRHVALRPRLGVGWSGQRGLRLNFGADGFYYLSPQKKWTPYVGAGLTYHNNTGATYRAGFSNVAPSTAPVDVSRSFLTLSTGVGVERSLDRRVAFFAEAGIAYSTGRRYEWNGTEWRRLGGFEARRPFRAGIGLTFKLR
jgi:hypothetical protein